MFGKHLVIHMITHRAKILDGKDSCGTSITLTKGMDLPDARDEFSNVFYLLFTKEDKSFWSLFIDIMLSLECKITINIRICQNLF